MSLDARYILHYENQHYNKPTPQQRDIDLLLSEIESLRIEDFHFIEPCTLYFAMPKYTLPDEIRYKLFADQIIERKDCDYWKII